MVLNYPLHKGKLAREWHEANIVPIHEGGIALSPVIILFLISICCKIMEHVILHTLTNKFYWSSHQWSAWFQAQPFLYYSDCNSARWSAFLLWPRCTCPGCTLGLQQGLREISHRSLISKLKHLKLIHKSWFGLHISHSIVLCKFITTLHLWPSW